VYEKWIGETVYWESRLRRSRLGLMPLRPRDDVSRCVGAYSDYIPVTAWQASLIAPHVLYF
jgi:hypothetical protein